MKLLITGGTGFIGSAVVRLALARGHSVINVDALTYASSPMTLKSINGNSRYVFEHANICSRKKLDQVFAKYSPDCVMHLAAESHVDRSIEGPTEFIKTNILGTYNLLEAAKSYWIEHLDRADSFRFHHVSTDEVYGSLGETGQFREDSPYDPRSPYSASKASSDHLVNSWYHTYGLPIVLSNCSNNFGPYQFPEKLIPVIILNAIAEKPLPVYGNGSNVRDWLYVDDHAEALMLILEKGLAGRNYNIGSENEFSNLQIVTDICELLDIKRPRQSGSYADLISFTKDRLGHDKRYAISPERIKQELNWTPLVPFKKGLELTVDWYLDNQSWWKPLIDRG